MQALLNFFSYSFLLFLGAAFSLSLLSAPLPFFVSFFYVAESATENITAQIQKPALQHNKKSLVVKQQGKTYGSATYYQNMQGQAGTTQIRRNNLMKYFLHCYAWCPCQKMRTPKLDSNILFQRLQRSLIFLTLCNKQE